MPASFKATSEQIQALGSFLADASSLSRESGVWFCAYGATEVIIPGGSAVRIAVDGAGDDMEYVVDDVVGG